VILGTSHTVSKNPFILTEKDFQTPLGTVSTDRELVQSIYEKYYYADLYEDELIHKYEHSIEFQTVFLQYLFGERKDFQIIPILCSSYHEIVEDDKLPIEVPAISDFISILKDVIIQSGKSVCFIASADLSHLGKRFGDDLSISSGLLSLVEAKDLKMLEHVENLDADAFFASVKDDDDDRKICGLSPIYTMLKVMNADKGQLLKYNQATEYDSDSVVSFASLSFN
jgi:AmmeMemoRadiSam system protein B